MNAQTPPSSNKHLRAIIELKFDEALEALHIKHEAYTPAQIEWAKSSLLKSTSFLFKKNLPDPNSRIFDFADKGVTNRLWLSKHRVSRDMFKKILIRNTHLIFLSNPERLEMNFDDHIDFFTSLGSEENPIGAASVTKALTDTFYLLGVPNKTMRVRFAYSAQFMSWRDVPKERWAKAVLKDMEVLRKPFHEFYDRYLAIENILGKRSLDQKMFANIIERRPDILSYLPETIENNIISVAQAFSDLGLDEAQWCRAGKTSPDLFFKKKETTIGNINTMIEWITPHGPTRKECLTEILKQPSNIHANALKLRDTFELIRVVTQIPALSAASGETRRYGQTLSALPKHLAFERFYCLTWGEDNLLLRAAIAELQPHETKLARVLSATRMKAERTFVHLLGHDPDQKEIPVSMGNGREGFFGKKAQQALQDNLHAHANELRQAWRQGAGLTSDKRQHVRTNVLGALMPFYAGDETNAQEKKIILERAVLSGLVKGYKLVQSP